MIKIKNEFAKTNDFTKKKPPLRSGYTRENLLFGFVMGLFNLLKFFLQI